MRLSRFQFLAVGLGVVALTASGSAAASAATGSADPADAVHDRCEHPLPAVVLGDPGVRPGAAAGVRVWHDASGWHLRATHPGTAPVAFSGVVHSGQPITAKGYHLEAGDSWKLAPGGRTLSFAFTNHGGVDGLDFTDACAINTSFALRRGGHLVTPVAVWLGAHGGHPTSNPFTVERHPG